MNKLILRIPLAERILFVLTVLALTLNPISNDRAMDFIDRAANKASRMFGAEATLIFAVYLIGYIGWNIYKSNKNNVPTKTTPTKKAGKFIATARTGKPIKVQ